MIFFQQQKESLIKFEDYIDTVWLMYDFKGQDQPISLINDKKLFRLIFIVFLCVIELMKFLYHGIVDSFVVRLYLCDVICTTGKFQYLFDLSICLGYFYFIRLSIIIVLKRNDVRHLKRTQFLKFLKCNEDELVDNYTISRKDASSFIRLTDLFIRGSRINVFLLVIYCLGLHSRLLYFSFYNLPLKAFIFSTIPNFFLFYVSAFPGYQCSNCSFVIFFLTCLFIHKNLKSTYPSERYPINLLNKKQEINLILLTLKSFNQNLRIFEPSQEQANLTVTVLYSMIMSIGLAFPYLIIFAAENFYMSLLYTFIYINGISISFYAIAKLNSLVDESVSRLFFLMISKTKL